MKKKGFENRKKQGEMPKMAAAIRYDAAKDDAPRLTAKGSGHVAEKIIELARSHDIPENMLQPAAIAAATAPGLPAGRRFGSAE